MGNAVAESFTRDMVNGDAESRSHWVTYTLGTVLGTKGAGNAVKSTRVGSDVTKAAKESLKNATNKAGNIQMPNLFPYGPQHQLATVGPVPYNVVDGVNLRDQMMMSAKKMADSNNVNPTIRLPRTNGKWKGEPGNGKWYSDKPEVKSITNGEGVEFINERPNFTPWSEGDLVFEKGKLTGTYKDFSLVYEKIQHKYNLPSKNAAKKLLKQAGVTPHHKSSTEIEIIPTNLHSNIPHVGSPSDLRGGY